MSLWLQPIHFTFTQCFSTLVWHHKSKRPAHTDSLREQTKRRRRRREQKEYPSTKYEQKQDARSTGLIKLPPWSKTLSLNRLLFSYFILFYLFLNPSANYRTWLTIRWMHDVDFSILLLRSLCRRAEMSLHARRNKCVCLATFHIFVFVAVPFLSFLPFIASTSSGARSLHSFIFFLFSFNLLSPIDSCRITCVCGF